MAKTTEQLGVSTIASGDAGGSEVVDAPIGSSNNMVGIETPESFSELTWLEASVTDGVWRRVQVYGVDVALPPNRFIVVDGLPCKKLRAASDTPVVQELSFQFWRILST